MNGLPFFVGDLSLFPAGYQEIFAPPATEPAPPMFRSTTTEFDRYRIIMLVVGLAIGYALAKGR